MGYGDGFREVFIAMMIVCFIAGLLVFGSIHYARKYVFHSDDIESSKPIIPIKKLVIENNKVDTVYIYRKP